MKKLLLALLVTISFLTADEVLTCEQQKNAFLTFSTIKVIGGKSTPRYDVSKGRMSLDKEYGGQGYKKQFYLFKNMTGFRVGSTGDIWPNNGYSVLYPEKTTRVYALNQIKELLDCSYKVTKTKSWSDKYYTYIIEDK